MRTKIIYLNKLIKGKANLFLEKTDDYFSRKRYKEVPEYELIEKIFRDIQGWGHFGGWALSKQALRFLFFECMDLIGTDVNIIEFGGGISTFFWYYLNKNAIRNLTVNTIEHHPEWHKKLSELVQDDGNIKIHHAILKQISDDEYCSFFLSSKNDLTRWSNKSIPVTSDKYEDTRIKNVFYDFDRRVIAEKSIDIMILDGPHGNGRALAFPLFSYALKRDAYILIDDYTHYPFLELCKKIYIIEEIAVNRPLDKPWVIVRVKGRK